MKNKLKLKKGDEVIVITGKDKGKTGKIAKIFPDIRKAIVSGMILHQKSQSKLVWKLVIKIKKTE